MGVVGDKALLGLARTGRWWRESSAAHEENDARRYIGLILASLELWRGDAGCDNIRATSWAVANGERRLSKWQGIAKARREAMVVRELGHT